MEYMPKQLISYYNNSELKQEILHEVREHVKNDQLIQGIGWDEEKQRGCFIGCITNCYDHQKASTKLGIPLWLLRLADKIHEGLPPKKTGEFFIGFFSALQIGMDKQHAVRVLHQFLYNTLTDVIPQQYQTKPKIAKIIGMLKTVLDGTPITIPIWRDVAVDAAAATYAAYAAASAAYAAADTANVNAAAATYAAYAAASAAYAAADTANVNAAANAAYAANTANVNAVAATYAANAKLSYEKMANSLIQILKEVKISE